MNLKGGRPEKFGRIASVLYRWFAEDALSVLHARIAGEIPVERGRLLDVGCGPGRLTCRIAESRPGLSVTGLDTSPAMIREARRAPAASNVDFREGGPRELRLPGHFDFALSVLSFHHWEEPVAELASIAGLLKPDGQLWIYEADPEASDEEIRADNVPLWGWLSFPPCWQRRMSRGHGFTRREIDEVVRPAVGQTPFRSLEVARSGAAYRLELGK